MTYPGDTSLVLSDVALERDRQEQLLAAMKFDWTCADLDVSDDEKLRVLVEEVGEVARAIHEKSNLREELIQVAAVCVAWCECL